MFCPLFVFKHSILQPEHGAYGEEIPLGKASLVGGFNPFEKYYSKWESSPNRGRNKKSLKPPPSVQSENMFEEVATLRSPSYCSMAQVLHRRIRNPYGPMYHMINMAMIILFRKIYGHERS